MLITNTKVPLTIVQCKMLFSIKRIYPYGQKEDSPEIMIRLKNIAIVNLGIHVVFITY